MPIGSGARYATVRSPGIDIVFGGANLNARQWSHPVFLASDTDPIRRIYLRDGRPAFASIRIPADTAPDPKADGHLHIIGR